MIALDETRIRVLKETISQESKSAILFGDHISLISTIGAKEEREEARLRTIWEVYLFY